jgi:hypothetical protein
VVLAVAVGFVLEDLVGVPGALLWSVLAGLVLAPLVPARARCGLTRSDPEN